MNMCETDDIAVHYFNNENCKSLRNKLKVFTFNILDENNVSQKFWAQTSVNNDLEENFLNSLSGISGNVQENIYRIKTGHILVRNIFINNENFLKSSQNI